MIDGDAEGSSGLVLTAVPLSDGTLLVVGNVPPFLQVPVDLGRDIGLAVFLDQGEDGHLDRCEAGMEPQNDTLLRRAALVRDGILIVGLAQECEGRTIGAGRRLDDVRNVLRLHRVVEVREILPASRMTWPAVLVPLDDEFVSLADQLALHVASQVEIAPVRDAFEFTELAVGEEWEGVLNVGRPA